MKIKVLMENTTDIDGMLNEHGLSLYIEMDKHKILFDTGQTDGFAVNAEKMGVDLSEIDFAVISHGHYDHSGGLQKFLKVNKKAPVYMSRYAFEPHYNANDKYIGVDKNLEGSDRLILTDDFLEIDKGLELISSKSCNSFYDTECFGLKVLENGELVPDDFRHEQYLMIQENGRNILFSGCSHKGILNIMTCFKPDILVGGFHFMKIETEGEGRKKLERAADILKGFDTDYYTCHCTGTGQYEILKDIMGDRLNYISAGQEINL